MKKAKRFKVKYVSDKPSAYLEKNRIYDAFYPLDVDGEHVIAVEIEDTDDPGAYAFPANEFEIIEQN